MPDQILSIESLLILQFSMLWGHQREYNLDSKERYSAIPEKYSAQISARMVEYVSEYIVPNFHAIRM